jgi:hypothetical protein
MASDTRPESYGQPKRKGNHDIGLGLNLAVMLGAVVALLGISIALWRELSLPDKVHSVAPLLGLFACAGALGGVLRSVGYLLAWNNFSARERRQWTVEALAGPILGAVAGIGAYLVVTATLVTGPEGVNQSGQYLLSLLVGTAALSVFGRIVERGLLRGTMSRSGILGSEVSPSVPLLGRLEQMLEQRVADLAIVNYNGTIVVAPDRRGEFEWMLNIRFFSDTNAETWRDDVSTVGLTLSGGIDRDTVPFTLSVVSERFSASPLLLSITVPRHGESDAKSILLQDQAVRTSAEPKLLTPSQTSGGREIESVILEIGQGTQTVQIVPIRLRIG